MRTRKRIRVENGEFPLSSMVDIVFLLLIYFIVTQKPIVEETLINAQLPTKPDTIIEEPSFPIKIDVLKEDGDLYRVMGNEWRKKDLFNYLQTLADNDPEQAIIISCGDNAQHQKLIELLDACSKAELTNLNIVNKDTLSKF